jgi:hypothetical protein
VCTHAFSKFVILSGKVVASNSTPLRNALVDALVDNIHHERMHLLHKDRASNWTALYDFVILC